MPQNTPISDYRYRPSRYSTVRSSLLLTLEIFLLVGLLFCAGNAKAQDEQGGEKPAASQQRALPVETAKAQIRPISQQITAVGTLTSNESVMIAAEIAGRVTEIDFSEGQRARAGQVLARLDSAILEAQRDKAEASLTLSRANLERADVLYRDEAISQRERDEASAQWRLDEASLRLAEAQLGKTVLLAPFDGILGLRHVSIGEYVLPGQPIVTLDDTDPIKVDFRVPEVYSPRLKSGQMVQVSIDATPGRTFTGEVYAVDPTVDPKSRSLLVRARVPNREGTMRPGMFAQIKLVTQERSDSLMIPEEALLTRGQDRFVYKIVDGVVAESSVTTGLRQRGLVEILEGLSPGDTVITGGQIKVRPGMPVSPLAAGGEN